MILVVIRGGAEKMHKAYIVHSIYTLVVCLEPELVRRGGCEIMQGFGTNQGNAAMQHLYFSPVLGARTYKAYT